MEKRYPSDKGSVIGTGDRAVIQTLGSWKHWWDEEPGVETFRLALSTLGPQVGGAQHTPVTTKTCETWNLQVNETNRA